MAGSCSEKTGAKLDYEKYTLDNGLQVVLHQDKSDPVVSVAIQYNVGSKDEKPGKTGFAHFFEHMLFQRSENLPRNSFFNKIESLGGSFNGGTSNDGTIYYETVPRDALETVLWMESDRMGYFINTITQGGLERETDVVSNEKRQYENAPYGLAGDILYKNLFPAGHPYSWTVIGELEDLRSATVEDVKEFYHKYYSPSNATIAIAGDFDIVHAKEIIEKYFGEIPDRPAPKKMEIRNITLDESKNVYYEDPFAGSPLFIMAFPGVEAYNPDGYALDFLANILAGDKKSPLYKVLVEDRKLVPNVSMYNYQLNLAGFIPFEATTFPGVKMDDVYDGIMEAFARFEKDGVNPKDLERYKIREQMNIYNSLTSVGDKAMVMARNNVFTGHPDYSITELGKYNAVTPEDIMRVYEKYIKDKNSLKISIVPAGQAELALTGSTPAAVNQESIEEQTLVSEGGVIVDDPYERTPSRFDRSVEPPLMPNTPELNVPEIWTVGLPGGTIIKGIKYTELPLVAFTLELNSGMLLDTPEKAGLASLTARTLREGTEFKTPEELEEAIGQLGATITINSSTETMTLSASCLKDKFNDVAALIEEMLLHPRWDEKAFAVNKERMLDDINQSETQPGYIATTVFRKALYGNDNILSFRNNGTRESVQALTMGDVRDFYVKNFSPAVVRMSYVGGHDKTEVEKVIGSVMSKVPDVTVNMPNITTQVQAPAERKAKLYFVDYPGARQSFIILGDKAMPASSPDAYPAVIVNDRLGGNTSSLLFEILRLERGYTYGAYSSFTQARYLNLFNAQSSVQAVVTLESVALFRDIVTNYGKTLTEDDLQKSKNSMLRKMAGSFETPGALVNMIRHIFVTGVPENYVKLQEETLRTMTMEDAQRVIGQYLNYDNMIFVVVGDAATQFENVKRSFGAGVIKVDSKGTPL